MFIHSSANKLFLQDMFQNWYMGKTGLEKKFIWKTLFETF